MMYIPPALPPLNESVSSRGTELAFQQKYKLGWTADGDVRITWQRIDGVHRYLNAVT